MARSTKASWLEGPGDLEIAEVENVPVPGESVKVRGLAAAYSNQASSEALEYVTGARGEQTAKVNQARMEVIQFAQGVIEPEFTEGEALLISQKFGPAFKKVIAKIDELSGVNKEEIENAVATFPAGGEAPEGAAVGNGAPADRERPVPHG